MANNKLDKLVSILDKFVTEKYEDISINKLKKCYQQFYIDNLMIKAINNIKINENINSLDYYLENPNTLLKYANKLTKHLNEDENDYEKYFSYVLNSKIK